MPAPKHLAAYPDEFFRIVAAFNAQQTTTLTIDCHSPGAAIHLRQLFYTFRTKLYEEAPQIAGSAAKQIQCTIRKGSPQVQFHCDFGSIANLRAQLDAQLGPELTHAQAPAAPPAAVALKAQMMLDTAKPLDTALDAARLNVEAPSATAHFEEVMAQLGFVASPLIRPGENATIPPGLSPDDSPTT